MNFLISLFFYGVIFSALVGCQLKPTTALEESTDIFAARTVLVDTRSALNYASFHVEGSVNLLVEDFLILKNPLAKKKNQKRVMDPDLKAIVERLARKGIDPRKKVFLIGDKKDSVENKKWKWLLNNLEVEDVTLYSLDEILKNKAGRFAQAEAVDPWPLKDSEYVQKEFILNKAQKCFADKYIKQPWPESSCNRF